MELLNEQLSTEELLVGSFLYTEENIPTISMKNATLHELTGSLKFHQDKTFLTV